LLSRRFPRPQTTPGTTGPEEARWSGGGQQPMPPGPESEFSIPAGARLDAAGRRPKGENPRPYTLPSTSYPGTHMYWVYVPAQYDPTVPACPDGLSGRSGLQRRETENSSTNVMDNLIYRREIPVMIGMFIIRAARPNSPSPHRRTGAMAREPAHRIQYPR